MNDLKNIIINIKIHMYSEKKKRFMLTLRGCNLTDHVLSLIFKNHQFEYHKFRGQISQTSGSLYHKSRGRISQTSESLEV